ncbi:MAG: hypothetical protein U5K51_11800 [Flavobacteriaceae bacterium]|nr:hypothetical protein [Flavobacteriaceae bacterium]
MNPSYLTDHSTYIIAIDQTICDNEPKMIRIQNDLSSSSYFVLVG